MFNKQLLRDLVFYPEKKMGRFRLLGQLKLTIYF
jgi:hypothetical protein